MGMSIMNYSSIARGQVIEERSEDTDDTDNDSVISYPAYSIDSVIDIDRTTPSKILSHEPSTNSRSALFSGKAKNTKKAAPPLYKGRGVVYLPVDIKGVARKLHLLAADFFVGNTTVRDEDLIEATIKNI